MTGADRVVVYRFSLNPEPARIRELRGLLSPEERVRSWRFRFEEHRRRYVVCRGTLREILARYLDRPSPAFRLAYNDHGKPSLPGSGVHFNLSHSAAWGMLAVTRGAEVGIDIQRIDPEFAREQIPERFFSPHEVAQLRALPPGEQMEAFFRCWTRKEAYIKARGLGLALALDSFDVTLGPDDPPLLFRAGNWSLQDVEAPDGYAAAIVVAGGSFTFSYCEPVPAEIFEGP